MSPGYTLNNKNHFKALTAILVLIALGSCTIVKKYQPGKPFVFRANINLKGNFSNEEKKALQSKLYEQLDDSMQARAVDKLAWKVIKNPPAYDSNSAIRSIIFMKALLKSYGYFNSSITFTTRIKKPKPLQRVFKEKFYPLRTIVDFNVDPGKLVHLDSVSYNIAHPELQRLADSTQKEAFIKKGSPFSKDLISSELDRLTELYRNAGYFRFTRDEMIGVWDTLDVSLLQPSLDPFEQLQILQKLKARRDSPTANLEIRLKSVDSSRLVKYYIGKVTIYPDYDYTYTYNVGVNAHEKITEDGIHVIQRRKQFKAKIFPPYIYLRHDSVYSQRRYLRTLNGFTSLPTWGSVSIDQVPRKDQDTLDVIVRLVPAKKYYFNANQEVSINQSPISGNLFGVGFNLGVQNRNFARAADLANTNARYGIELGNAGSSQFIQSKQISFSHTIYFPRFIPNTKLIPERYRDNLKTVFSFYAANTDRRFLYNLTTINGSWGYEYQRKRVLASIKFPNIEYSYLVKRDSLDTLIKYNPSLKNIFTDGLIASTIGSLTITGGKNNALNAFRTNLEIAGIPYSIIRNAFLDKELYNFIKLDADFARLIRRPKSSIALHVYGGIGYEFDFTRNADKRNTLPFFKEFYAGGPNSMRAWALRRLGPGSSIKPFTGPGSTPDRYGDIQLEANAEYRFPIGTPFGQKVNGAIFTDIGNVWFLKKNAGNPEEVFNFSRLGKDIAVGAGVGLRVDFNFFVVRFDYSYKVKDPSPAPADAPIQNKWFGYRFFKGDQFQLGIGYPFIF